MSLGYKQNIITYKTFVGKDKYSGPEDEHQPGYIVPHKKPDKTEEEYKIGDTIEAYKFNDPDTKVKGEIVKINRTDNNEVLNYQIQDEKNEKILVSPHEITLTENYKLLSFEQWQRVYSNR